MLNMLKNFLTIISFIVAVSNGQPNTTVATTTEDSGPTTTGYCHNPRISVNTSTGFAQSIEAGYPLQTSNCSWDFQPSDDGYLTLSNLDGAIVWTSEKLQTGKGSSPYELELTIAGNLRFLDDTSDILWETNTTNEGERPYNLSMTFNGNVFLRDDNGEEIWSLFCENSRPYYKSGTDLPEDTPIYSSQCEYFLMLNNYTIEVYECSLDELGKIQNDTTMCEVVYSLTDDDLNETIYDNADDGPYYMDIDDSGALGVKDSSGVWLWTVTKLYESDGALPYYLRVMDNGKLSIYDSLNTLMWDTSIEEIAHEPKTEIWETLVFSLYFGFFSCFMFFQLFRVAYLTRNRKKYRRDAEAGAMHYTKRSELRTKLAESVTLGGPTAGGPTAGSPGDDEQLLLGDQDDDDNKDDVKSDSEDIATDDDASMNEEDRLAQKQQKRKAKLGRSNTQARLDAAQEKNKGFKFLSREHFNRWGLIIRLFNDMVWVSLIHFFCNACSYALLVRWCLAIWGSDPWRPENLTNEEFRICCYLLIGILGFYHINSAYSLRISYRDTFYGLANKKEITYVEQKTMSNVFYQQLVDLRVLREVRSSAFNEQGSQFFVDISKTKYAVSAVPQCILSLYYIMRVEDYELTWIAWMGLGSQLIYILTNNIQTDSEVFRRSASQTFPPTPGFIARVLFRCFEIIARIAIFALAAVVVHWTGVVILLCYHLLANFIFFQGSLLGKDGWNIVYFVITVADLGLVSRRRELDSWLARTMKYFVHIGRAMTCFVLTSSFDSACHCVRLDEQLLFDFMFGRFIESMGELILIFWLASWHDDGYLPPTDQEGTLLFLAFLSSISFLVFFFILRLSKQFDQNRSSHRNALDLARDGRWDMLSDYIPLYTEQEINKCDRFGDRTNILIYSAEEAQTKIVMQLLDRECDVSLSDRRGNTALHKAAKNGRIDILEALIAADSDVNKANHRGWTPLHVACRERHFDCVRKLVDAGAAPLATLFTENLTCIGVAMRFGSLDIVKHLLTEIKVTHYTDSQIEEAMEYVSTCEDFGGPLVHALHYGESKTAKVLLECRVQNVNAQDHFGETALHKSCSWGYHKIGKELIRKYDADVNIISDKGYSPFHIAVARQFPKIVDMLVKHDATVDFPTIAFAEKILLKTCITGYDNIFGHVIKLQDKLDLDARDLDGNSALLLASQNKNHAICRHLIKAGCDVTLRNMWGKSIFDTPLPDNLREAVDYVLKVQGGLIAVHGDQGATPGMGMVTPGIDNQAQEDAKYDDDDEPGIMGIGGGGPRIKKVDSGVIVPESQGILGWGPGGGPGGGPG